jgi:hypothetical protein
MEKVTCTSGETEAMRAAHPASAESHDGCAGTKTAQTNQPEIEPNTEPENAGAHSESKKPGRPDSAEPESSEPRPTGPERAEASPSGPGPGASTEPNPEKINRDIRYVASMLETTPLAAGESRGDYSALLAQIRTAVEPTSLFDHVRLCDLGHALWEEKRYRRQLVALPGATRFKALVALVLQFSPNYQIKASEIALDYFGADEERRARAERLLRRYGITDDAITAQAHEMHAQTIGALERMVSHRQTLRNRVIKEVKRDKRQAEKRKAKPKPEDGAPASGTTH